jgi:hypothetical protein
LRDTELRRDGATRRALARDGQDLADIGLAQLGPLVIAADYRRPASKSICRAACGSLIAQVVGLVAVCVARLSAFGSESGEGKQNQMMDFPSPGFAVHRQADHEIPAVVLDGL